MKKLPVMGLLFAALGINAQNTLTIPPIIQGATIDLTMAPDSVQFMPGIKTATNGYNGSYLGPTIILNQGDDVTLNVTNNLDDQTTTHWHGLHIAAENDGGPHSIIEPGDTWSPQFTVMDKASTYWYHPHLHELTGEQVMKGLAGLIIVKDAEEALLNLPRDYGVDDFPLVVQTQQFDMDNQVMVDGMRDSTMIVNGTIDPMVDMPAQIVRMRILNADQERNYNFGFTNDLAFSVIGSDGGLLLAPVGVTRVRLAPGERAEILVDLSGMVGQTTHLMSYASEIPMMTQGGPTMTMQNGMPMMMMHSPLNGSDFDILEINVIAATANPVTTIPATLVTPVIPNIAGVDVTRIIKFTPLPASENPTQMELMDGPFFFNDSTFDMNRIDQDIPLGNVEIWELRNMTMVAHPFHIHDVQFFILDIDGMPASPDKQGRKDVVSVPPMDTVRFITVFEDFAGPTPFMYHCHNLMHEDGGMMGQFVVTDLTAGVDDISDTDFNVKVYPNPSNGELTIERLKASTENLQVEIVDVTGSVIYKNQNLISNKIDLSKIPNGVYVMSITDGEFVQNKRIVIQH